jgi:hypothetical protein
LSAFASAAAPSAAERATGAERRGARDARARRAGATAGADEHPTAETRDMGGAATGSDARLLVPDTDNEGWRRALFETPSAVGTMAQIEVARL